MVFGFQNGRRSRPARRRAARRGLESLERRDLMALVVEPLSFDQNVPFQGRVATFQAGDLPGTIADFQPTIDWGDDSTASNVQIIPDGPDAFAIIASKTYDKAGVFSVGVLVAGTEDSAIFDTASATVIGVPPTPSGPSAITATAGRPFAGAVAGFAVAETDGSPTAADFAATIDWGDGQTSPGVVVATGGEGTNFVVTGTHEYATPGSRLARVAIAQAPNGPTISTETNVGVYAFAGGLDPLSIVDQGPGGLTTNQQTPILSGTAEPRSTIRLWMRSGSGVPVVLGETMANAAGRWSLAVGPLGEGPFQLLGSATPTSGSPLPTTPLNGGLPIIVDLHPARPISAVFQARANRVVVMVGGGRAGADPSWLNQPGAYALIDAEGGVHHPTSVRAARVARGRPGSPRPVVLSFARGSLPRDGELRLNVTSLGGPISGGVPIASLVVARGRR